jgi:hypothetical protein
MAMDKNFTEKQREIVARKMGYEGPMSMFDTYLKSSPAEEQKYAAIGTKFMAKGGVVKKAVKPKDLAKYGRNGDSIVAHITKDEAALLKARGGSGTTNPKTGLPEFFGTFDWNNLVTNLGTNYTQEQYDTAIQAERDKATAAGTEAKAQFDAQLKAAEDAAKVSQDTAVTNALKARDAQLPDTPTAPKVTPTLNTATQDQLINTQLAPTQAATVTPTTAPTAATVTAPATGTAATYQATTSVPDVAKELAATEAAKGTVSQQAQVTAAQAVPTATAVGDLTAAQGTATQVTGAPTRTVQEGELVTGTGVDQAKVEAMMAKNVAAQGAVTEEMTIQGQLNKLTADFDAGNPPAWAAASMRAATAQLAARGLGASSLAGQAIIQATLEAATPIAAADAKVYETMGLTNLSNRQAMAIATAQQRAQFLGQEFDQTFQTKVLNAAKIADVANMNFTAQQQVALENARLAQTMDLANLSNKQALVMAEAAQIANLETANLNNRQQAAVVNAQSFLQMDMANLNNEQQTELFKSQQAIQSILTDTAAQNAAKQFNATSQNQVDQFYASLTTQVQQFNATQTNAMNQFNTDQTNSVNKFNTEMQNQRDQFNAQNRLVIDQSNAQWRREISTANTAAINRANEINATNALQVTMAEYNNEWQTYRDRMEYSWKASENEADRINKIATQEIDANARILAATLAKDADIAKAYGTAVAGILGSTSATSTIGSLVNWGADKAKDAAGAIWDWATSAPPNVSDENSLFDLNDTTNPGLWETESYD